MADHSRKYFHYTFSFISFLPRQAYRQIRVGDLLELCGFNRTVCIEEAMHALRRLLKDYQAWDTPSLLAGDNSNTEILLNDIPALHAVPSKFWMLCQKVLAFRQQRPTNLPVSVRRLHSWNLNSWHPDASTNAHKTGIIRSLLRAAPVLLQETKWTEVQLQHLLRTWPDIKLKLPLPLPNMIPIPKQELRFSSRLDGSLAVKKSWLNIML